MFLVVYVTIFTELPYNTLMKKITVTATVLCLTVYLRLMTVYRLLCPAHHSRFLWFLAFIKYVILKHT